MKKHDLLLLLLLLRCKFCKRAWIFCLVRLECVKMPQNALSDGRFVKCLKSDSDDIGHTMHDEIVTFWNCIQSLTLWDRSCWKRLGFGIFYGKTRSTTTTTTTTTKVWILQNSVNHLFGTFRVRENVSNCVIWRAVCEMFELQSNSDERNKVVVYYLSCC